MPTVRTGTCCFDTSVGVRQAPEPVRVAPPAGRENRLFRRARGRPAGKTIIALAGLATILALGLPSAQAGSAPALTFYVPFPEADYMTSMTAIENGGAGSTPSNPVTTYISIAAIADGTVIYYDHWEDGYETSLRLGDPLQATTLIWGDNNPTNGMPPGFTNDYIRAGSTILLYNQLTSSVPLAIDFDGRDKIEASRAVSITRTFWTTGPETLLAGSFEVLDTTRWGLDFRCPVGQDIPDGASANVGDHQMFEYTGLSVIASKDGTTVRVDADNNGVFETTNVLNQGQTLLVNGGVNVGGRVLADKPINVILINGDVASNYESRDSTLMPLALWSRNYYTPVSTPTGNATRVWLYNPTNSAITISYDTRGGTNAIVTASTNIAAGSYGSVLLPTNVAARFYSSGGATGPVFYAYSTTDSDVSTTSDNQAWDWSFTLIPDTQLVPQLLVGLGIGRDPMSAVNPSENGNPIWVTTVGNGESNVTVYVDYDGDGLGPLTDPNGFNYDTNYTARELQQLKIYDPDGDQSSMLVYVLATNVNLAGAWGQDPLTATAGAPGLDVGTSVPPVDVLDASKDLTLVTDADGDGYLGPSERAEYLITVGNTTRAVIPAAVFVIDSLPVDTTYVPGTTEYRVGSNGLWTAIADNGTGTAFPLDGTGIVINAEISIRNYIYVRFQVDVKPPAELSANPAIVNTGSVWSTKFDREILFENETYLHGSLGDYVWLDADGDGVQDPGEPGISNVVVYADMNTNGVRDAGEPMSTTTTNGYYLLSGGHMVAGTYRVRVDTNTLPAGLLPTYDLDGTATTHQATAALAAGQDRTDVDFGYIVTAALGDFTWVDGNMNGQQDGGEVPLSNVVVRLYNATSNVIGTTTSSVAGIYGFTNLYPGAYFVAFTPPAGYFFTTSNVGSDATDSDPLAGTNRTAFVTLTNGQTDLTVDAGFVQAVALGNYTWQDNNFNGQQDGGEPALSNVVVRLYDAASNVVGVTTSSAAGLYAFTNLPPGTYSVGFTPPAGYSFTTANTGADATDSDANPATGMTGSYTLTSGQTDNTVDAGFYNPANVSLKLFKSSSLTGNWDLGATNDYYLTIQNTGTVALAGIALTDALPPGTTFVPGSAQIVRLTAVTTNPFVDTVSDGFGTVSYANNNGSSNWVGSWNEIGDNASAASGDVLVRVAGGTNALVFENTGADNDHVTRTNALTPRAGRTYTNMALAFAYRRENWDAGDSFTLYVSTNGFAGQSNLVFAVPTTAGSDAAYVQVATNLATRMGANVAVRLRAGAAFDASDRINFDFLTFTNSGYDIATNTALSYGSGVSVTVVSNLAATTPANLLSNYTLPGGSSLTVRIRATLDVPLVSTQFINTAMATNPVTPTLYAFVTNYSVANSVGDRAWNDANANGIQDGGEAGVTGVTVRLYSADAVLLGTTTTDATGFYSFTNLPSGAYYLEFWAAGYYATLQDQGGSDALDSDIDGAGRTAVFALSGGTNDTSRDAGGYLPAALGDYTWVDENYNGQQDVGEPPLSNVVVTLYNAASNVIGTTTSSAAGAYAFTNLVPGDYFVGFTPPAGYLFTTSNVGADATDSDVLAGTNRTALVTLVSGQNDPTVDAGFYRPASLGDYTWVDSNFNGQQDGGEPALSNVVVTLYNAASNVIGVTTSSAAGAYAFTNLPPGSYFVGFAPPSGYLFTTANLGADASDSDVLAGTNRTALITLANGQTDNTVDAGFYQMASLGDYTWVDSNGNGQQDGGEPALSNVVVTLYNAASNAIGTTTSSVAGAYAFTNLVPGTYFVGFTPPAGYLFTTSNVGADATDSDALAATGLTGSYALTSGQTDNTVDAGFYNPEFVSMKLFKSTSLLTNWNFGVTNDYYMTIQNTGTVALTGVGLADVLPPGVSFVSGSAAIVQLLAVTTNPFTETVSDGFGTAAYNNNDGTTNWLGNWTEVGDDGSATTGSELIRTAGGTNALVFELTNADNDHVTRTNRLSLVAGRTYTNSVLSFAYRRENWDANDFITFRVSTNGFAGQSNLVYTVPSGVITDAAYSNATTNLTAFMGATLSLRLQASPNFAAGDRVNFDFITITHSGYDVATNAVPVYSNGVIVSVVSNLASATLTNLLSNYTLPAGSSVTVRIRATLDVPLVSTQFINTATATNPATPPATAWVTNYSILNSVGDRAWNDLDSDGIQDGGEPGLTGVTVRIYSAASNLLATTVTGVGGVYSFTNLPTGSYFLEFVPPMDYVISAPDQGTDDALDSDIGIGTGRTAVFALAGGTNDTTRDAGLYLPSSSLGDFVWRDVNGDGIQNGGSETGMPGVVVRLYDAASNLVATTTSLASGAYAFTNIPTATYFLEFAAPSNFMFILPDQGGDDTVDSDVAPATGRTAAFYLPPGVSDLRWDAGLWEVVQGLRLTKTSDAGSCLAPGDTITYTMTIQNTGTVTHAGIVLEDPLPLGLSYVPGSVNWTGGTLATSGPPPTLLTNLTLTTGQIATVTFQATVDLPATVTQLLNTATARSPVQPAIHAGATNCVIFADVGVEKFVTDNTPDMLQAIEYSLVASNNGPNVATGVVLTDVLPPQVQYNSHSNGTYDSMAGVWTIGTLAVNASTTLYVHVTVRENTAGLHITNHVAVTGRDLYDPNPSNDTSHVVIVPNPGVNIGDRIWFDANRDGIQNAGETNVFAGIPVALLDTNGNMRAALVTDNAGNYLFTNQPPGVYLVRFDLASISTNETISTAKAGGDDELDSDAITGNVGDYAWTAAIPATSGQTTYAIDLGITTRGSTRAEVVDMWGEWSGGQGRVAWRTGSEFGTAGFFVYRIDPETGAETRLSDNLLPSAFKEDGAIYRLADPAARAGETGTYRLEEVELTGAAIGLPEQTVRFVAPPPAPKAARGVQKSSPAKQVLPKRPGPSAVLKMQVPREGLHGVSLQAIADGMGLAPEAAAALAGAGSLRITEQGSPVPVIYDAARGRLVFHAKSPVRSWYTHEAAYLLSAGEGLAMPRRAPGAAGGAAAFPVQLHFEEDQFLFAMTQMPDDFYFWAGVVSQTNDLLAPRFPLDLAGYAGGDVRLKVRLMGWSVTAAKPDHLAEFSFNGRVVGTVMFDDQETAEAELTIPAALVVDGENTLMVNGVLQPGRSHSFFVVDWIEASFSRTLAPRADSAFFRADGAASVSAAAFAEPLALALDDAGNPTWIVDENGGLPAKAWAVTAPDERFEVIEAGAVPMLEPEPAAADAWFLARTNRIDYLVIASRALAPAAQELAAYRSGQGLRAGVAVFEDVCDLLTGGVRTPEAVPELLSYAATVWARPPQMVVLAGNGHYDYLGVNTSEANHLPPLLVQTPSGVCAADNRLADAGGDAGPDVAIGRLPALTEADLAAMIAKIKAYEAGFGSAWQNQLVLVADKADSAGQFRAVNDQLAQLAAEPYSVADRIELDTQALASARSNLLARFRTGAGFIHYTGHGGLHNLSSKNLLTEADVAGMDNAACPPITVALTCLAGRYEVPTTSSLGEVLMRRAQGGAVAVLGPSGLSRNAPATELGAAFYRAVLQEGEGRLGQAFLKARRSLPETLFSQDTFEVYNLLGDPALRVAGNDVTNAAPVQVQVLLADLEQVYDGTARRVTAATVPAGLGVDITYNGSTEPPTEAGSYAVAASVFDADYEGNATGTLVVAKAPAEVTLAGLVQTYDGTSKPATATTRPAGLAVAITYNGAPSAPTAAGTYAVAAMVSDANRAGTATGILTIGKADQALDFPEIGDRLTLDTVVLAAAASSGLPVAYEVVAGPAVISDGTVLSFTGAGRVTIRASQGGDANWNAAADVLRAFQVRSPVVISSARANVRENGEGRFFVKLARAPEAAVVVTVTRTAGDVNLVVKNGATRSFTAANWNTWQPVTLAANDDANAADETATFRVSLPGTDQFVEGTALDDDIGENRALAANGATITGTKANLMALLIDGVHSSSTNYGYTVWTNNPPGTMTLDLAVPTTVFRMRLLNWDWSYRTHRYRIEASLDGVAWQLLADAGAADRQGWDDWAVSNQVLRFLRFTGLDNSAGAVDALAEWEVYGQGRPAPVVSKSAVNVRENGEGRFFVRLAAAPTGTVVVSVSRTGGDGNLVVKSGAARVFRPTTWNTWQPVTLAANEDDGSANETAQFRISVPGEPDQQVEATALDDDLGENLALASGGAAITENKANQAALLIDGVHAASTNYGYTVWTNVPPGTMTLDLNGLATVSRVRLLNWDWAYRTHRYLIEASQDGTVWTILANAGATDRQGWDDWAVNGQTLRYLRFTGLSNSVDGVDAIVEWEVYGTRPPLPQMEISRSAVNVREAGEGRFFVRLASAPAGNVVVAVARSGGDSNLVVRSGATRTFTAANWGTWQPVALAAGPDANNADETALFRISAPGAESRFVEATALDVDIGQNLALAAAITGWKSSQSALLVDGVHTSSANYGYTLWTNVPPGTMTLDLGGIATVSRVRLLNWDWSFRTHRYVIESSPDGAVWTVLADASGGPRQGWDDWAVADESIRYLRFTGLSNSTDSIEALVEWEVYGTPAVMKRGRVSLATGIQPACPVTVLTSDGPKDERGWLAVDGDPDTAWQGRTPGSGYIVVGYESAFRMKALEVDLAADSLTGIQYLSSLDGDEWAPLPEDMDRRPVALKYLWLLFPDTGERAVPKVLDIRPIQ